MRIVALGVARLRRRGSRYVAERAEPSRDVGRLGPLRAGADRVEIGETHGERPRALAGAIDEIHRFPAIARQVVELRQRQLDVLVAADHDAVEGREPEVEHRLHRLEVRRARRRAVAIRARAQRVARQLRRSRQRERIEDGRDDVDVTGRRIGHFGRALRPLLSLRDSRADVSHDQRYVQRRFVREEAVRRLAVIAECLTVITGEHDERRARRGTNRVEKRRERAIGRRHLAVVRARGVLAIERSGRTIRRVRLVEVHPREPAAAARVDPVDGARDHDRTGPLGQQELGAAADIVEASVVDVEASRQTEARVERKGGDERGGLEGRRLQPRCECLRARRQARARVLAIAVLIRVQPREDAGVRGQRHHRLRVREREPQSVGGERVDRGRSRRTAVAAERIAAQGVDSDQQDVAVGILNQKLCGRTPARRHDRRSHDGSSECAQ